MTTLTYTTGVKITRRDSTVEAYTSHDKDLTVGAQLYRSIAAYTPTGVSTNTELKPDNIDISGIIDGVYVKTDDLRAGDYDGAKVEIIRIDWSTSTKDQTLIVGTLGNWQILNQKYVIEFNSIEQAYSKPLGRIVTLRCQWELGSAKNADGTGCGYTLSSVSSTVTGQGSPANRFFVDTARTEADDYFKGGKVTWTSGANNGRSMDVKAWTNATKTFELWEPMLDDIEAADGYDAVQGCDKTLETCRDTFNNVANHGGFRYLPGVTDVIGKQTG